MSNVSLHVDFGPEWLGAIAGLDHILKSIPRDIDKVMKRAAQKGAAGARAGAMKIPSKGVSRNGMRRKLAAGVGVQRRAPGRYRVTTSMPPGEGALPRGFEGMFRHPVFGGPTWVAQHTHVPWFTEPVSDQYDFALRGLIEVLEDAAETVDRMAGG